MPSSKITAALPVLALLLAAGCAAHAPLARWQTAEDDTIAPAPASQDNERAFNQAVAMAAQRNYSPAAQTFADLAERFDSAANHRRAAECLFWQAYCLEKQDKTYEAARLYQRVMDNYPSLPPAAMAARRLANLRNGQ